MGVITSGWEPNGIIKEQKAVPLAVVEITPMVLLEEHMFSYIAVDWSVDLVSDWSSQQNAYWETHNWVYCSLSYIIMSHVPFPWSSSRSHAHFRLRTEIRKSQWGDFHLLRQPPSNTVIVLPSSSTLYHQSVLHPSFAQLPLVDTLRHCNPKWASTVSKVMDNSESPGSAAEICPLQGWRSTSHIAAVLRNLDGGGYDLICLEPPINKYVI